MRVNPVVFFVSAALTALFAALGALFPEGLGEVFASIQAFIVGHLGWFYILAAAFFLGFVIWLLFSPFAHFKLGKPDDEPEFSTLSWFAMLFSAGMGIGLLFYGVAEPIMHLAKPPDADPETFAAAREAMLFTYFHWGLHAWAIYAIIGMSLAYFAYRHDLPLTIRSTLFPLIGRRIHGPIGDAVEIFAVFGTLFGIATSLGFGVSQVNAGLAHLGLMDVSTESQVILIAIITVIATASVVSGLDKGIRRLSESNLLLAVVLLLFVAIVGPTVFIISLFTESVGNYLANVVSLTFRTDSLEGSDWQGSWTVFYWGWWISWSPFVGMFIARISRGRTLRQFILGVLLVPTLLTFLWMAVFGGAAIHTQLFGDGSLIAIVAEDVPQALFGLLESYPAGGFFAFIAVLVVTLFFVTSSDSGSLVIDSLTSGGAEHTPVWQRIFWCFTEGGVAAVLMLAGGLAALQTAAITTALPFAIIMIAICFAFARALVIDKRRIDRAQRAGRLPPAASDEPTRVAPLARAPAPAPFTPGAPDEGLEAAPRLPDEPAPEEPSSA